ncbi:MAG: shikimate kinase [Gemmatimonadetes bacterium]|nr:shikimate kinase [Gemmatimonadota bacterium]
MASTTMRAGDRRGATGARTSWQRVVLVGFMGSGKSTVGRLLASRLGWTFVDLDEAVEKRAGASVEELFRTRGEETFRALEREAGAAALARPATVLAPGGGWSIAPGRLDELPDATLTVWLKVSPETAVRRATGHGRVRPLLAGPDAVVRARELLGAREPLYAKALLHLDAERAIPAALADAIVEHMEEPSA